MSISLKTPLQLKNSTGKLTYKRTHRRQLSVNIKKQSFPLQDLTFDSVPGTSQIKFSRNKYNFGTKRELQKNIESSIKDLIKKFTENKIKVFNKQAIKREKHSDQSELLFTSFLLVFGELDQSISTKGLKSSPFEVMMNYLSIPSKVEKTLEKIEVCLKQNRLSEGTVYSATLLKSFSIFSKIKSESLSTSKIIHDLLSMIFEYMGIENNENQVSNTTNTLSLAKSALKIIKPKTENQNHCFSATEKPETLLTDITYLLETPNHPPRISQKYIDSRLSRISNPSTFLILKPHIISN